MTNTTSPNASETSLKAASEITWRSCGIMHGNPYTVGPVVGLERNDEPSEELCSASLDLYRLAGLAALVVGLRETESKLGSLG